MDLPNFIGQTSVSDIVMTLLLVVNGFFLSRYFRQNDALAATLGRLDTTIAVLSSKLEHLQSNDDLKTKTIQRLMTKMIRIQELMAALRAEFDSCRSTCKEREKNA